MPASVPKKGQNLALSEHGHAYQIKWNHKCSNMVANVLPRVLPAEPPTPLGPGGWGQKIKIQIFQNMVMLRIKLKGIKNAATW